MSAQKFKAEDFITAIKGSRGMISAIANRVGCNRSTVYKYINDYVTVKQALDDERESMKDFAESKLFQQINNDNITALIFYLKTQVRDRGYIEKINIEGNLNISIVNKLIKTIEDADLDPADVFERMIQRLDADH